MPDEALAVSLVQAHGQPVRAQHRPLGRRFLRYRKGTELTLLGTAGVGGGTTHLELCPQHVHTRRLEPLLGPRVQVTPRGLLQ